MFLMPGLADMHVQLPPSGAPPEEIQDFLFLLLANNVTVARGIPGWSGHLQIKGQVASGEMDGPTLFVGSPPIDEGYGRMGQSPEAAVDRMLSYRSAGFDLLTLGPDIQLETWNALTKEAHNQGFSFGGTIPRTVGLRQALSSGVSTIEQLDGYLEEVASDPIQARLRRGENVPLREQLESVDGRKMRAIAAHTRSSDSWVVPTLFSWETRYRRPDVDSILALPEMRFVSGSTKDGWILALSAQDPVEPETAELLTEVRQRLLRALVMAGVGVLMGTDSPEMFSVPGFSLRHELRSMEGAGLTPYEILVTGTRNVADYARGELLEPGNFGTVEAGNRADLILLKANPLQDLEALWDQEGVMVRGRWIPRSEIDERLAAMAEKFGG